MIKMKSKYNHRVLKGRFTHFISENEVSIKKYMLEDENNFILKKKKHIA